MVCACLVATVLSGSYKDLEYEGPASPFEVLEGVSEEEAYLNGKNSLASRWVVAMRSGVTSRLMRFILRGIQDYSAVSWAAIAWQAIKTDRGSSDQCDGGRTEFA